MSAQLDTSSMVNAYGGGHLPIRWSDLDAFTQGYIEALMGDVEGVTVDHFLANGRDKMAFVDLAPEALARIIEDCAEALAPFGSRAGGQLETHGRRFWETRQRGGFGWRIPRLTITLGDDGKVRFAPTPPTRTEDQP